MESDAVEKRMEPPCDELLGRAWPALHTSDYELARSTLSKGDALGLCC